MVQQNSSQRRHREVERWLSPRIIGFMIILQGMALTALSVTTAAVTSHRTAIGIVPAGVVLIRLGAKVAFGGLPKVGPSS